MQFTCTLMDAVDARVIKAWRYEEPYAIYSMGDDDAQERNDPEALAEFLERRSPYYSVRDEHRELVGFFNLGTSALVWGSPEPDIYVENKTVALGIGMRPDMTGKGLGLTFVEASLEFARKTFAPEHFLLFVYTWNKRAIRVYERAGFRHVRVFTQRNIHGEAEFLQMERDA